MYQLSFISSFVCLIILEFLFYSFKVVQKILSLSQLSLWKNKITWSSNSLIILLAYFCCLYALPVNERKSNLSKSKLGGRNGEASVSVWEKCVHSLNSRHCKRNSVVSMKWGVIFSLFLNISLNPTQYIADLVFGILN